MEFTSDFVSQVDQKREYIQSSFSDSPEHDRLDVVDKVEKHWHETPDTAPSQDVSKLLFMVQGLHAVSRMVLNYWFTRR